MPFAVLTVAHRSTARPPSLETTDTRRPAVPSGFTTIVPVTLAFRTAPHPSSVPATVKPPPAPVSVSASRLQYGWVCHTRVWAAAGDPKSAAAITASPATRNITHLHRRGVGDAAMNDRVERNGRLAPAAERQPVGAWHGDAEFGGEAVVERDEVALQCLAAIVGQVRRQRPRRAVAGRERVPRGFRAGLAIEGDGLLEAQVEVRSQELL